MKNDPLQLLCPVCGQLNQCAAASGGTAQDCWCYNAVISAEALAAIPPRDIGKRCLCPACAGVKGENVSER